MKLEEISKSILRIDFKTQLELTSTFLRFQEYFESPEFKGRVFSLEEYKEWYISNSPKGKETGEFTYYADWNGFNIPSEILEPFYNGNFDPLTEQEKTFLDLFKGKENKFYIIGTHRGSEHGVNSLKHEIAHGLFYTNPLYKNEALQVLSQIPSEEREKINRLLSNLGGYHPSVWEDETHAFLIYGFERLIKKSKVEIFDISDFREELNTIFEKYLV